jgi:hypothetical protein
MEAIGATHTLLRRATLDGCGRQSTYRSNSLQENTMGLIKGIASVFNKVENFAKRAVGFANTILNGPIGRIASYIPGIGPLVSGASKIVGIADGVLRNGGLKSIVGNLVGGLLNKAGSFLSRTGLSSVVNLALSAIDSGELLELVKKVMEFRQRDQSPLAAGDRYNVSQAAAYSLGNMLRSQQG